MAEAVREAGGHQVQAHHPAAVGQAVEAAFRAEAVALEAVAAAEAGETNAKLYLTTMRKNLLLLTAILIFASLLMRTVFVKLDSLDGERKWFVENLNYQFSFVVDTVSVYGYDGKGFLVGHIVSGNLKSEIEHELVKQLKVYQSLAFLKERMDGTYLLSNRAPKRYQKDDSLYIDSDKGQIVQYREGKILAKEAITESLMATLF